MTTNVLTYLISMIGIYLSSGIFQYFFIYFISLCFIATVPIIIRSLISVFSR